MERVQKGEVHISAASAARCGATQGFQGTASPVYQLARKTGRDLITADVTKIKSNWVGESEQNIKGLFSPSFPERRQTSTRC